jgi:hypothetical protein
MIGLGFWIPWTMWPLDDASLRQLVLTYVMSNDDVNVYIWEIQILFAMSTNRKIFI